MFHQGSTATFDGSSDDLKGTTGDLKDLMVSTDTVKGHIHPGSRGSRGSIGMPRESNGTMWFVRWVL